MALYKFKVFNTLGFLGNERLRGAFWVLSLLVSFLTNCKIFKPLGNKDFNISQTMGNVCPKTTHECAPLNDFLAELDRPQLPDAQEINNHIIADQVSYYFATELDTESLNKTLGNIIKSKKSARGVQIAVGTERGLLTASGPYLILADSDKFVRLYNFINLALLNAASDIETYRQLRFARELSVWTKFKVNLGPNLDQISAFSFWNRSQLSRSFTSFGYLNFNLMLSSPPLERIDFIKENFNLDSNTNRIPLDQDYVWNNDRFLKLKEKQQSGRIAIYAIDFTNIGEVDQLISILKKRSIETLSVDFSNIHIYVNWKDRLLPTIEKFKDSYVVLSHVVSGIHRLTRPSPKGPPRGAPLFRYYIFSPGEDYQNGIANFVLKNLPTMRDLNSDIVTRMEGNKILEIHDGSCSVGLAPNL